MKTQNKTIEKELDELAVIITDGVVNIMDESFIDGVISVRDEDSQIANNGEEVEVNFEWTNYDVKVSNIIKEIINGLKEYKSKFFNTVIKNGIINIIYDEQIICHIYCDEGEGEFTINFELDKNTKKLSKIQTILLKNIHDYFAMSDEEYHYAVDFFTE